MQRGHIFKHKLVALASIYHNTTIMKKDFSSLIVLILVNMIPLVGVLFWGWSPMEIVYLYWVETLIIGLFNVAKMLIAAKSEMPIFLKIFLAGFFIVHFGIFCGVQGIFILLLGAGDVFTEESVDADIASQEILQSFYALVWPTVLIFGSHLFSFFYNYIGKKEYKKSDPSVLMMQPYSRVFVQQFLAIFGTWLALAYAGRIWIMLIVVIAKTLADAGAHLRAHKSKEE